MTIAENLERIRERIATAARRANRNPDEIQLMAVSKTVAPEVIREAYDAGQRMFGENRIQEFAEKHADVRDLLGVEWRLIGHLQTNKVTKAVDLFDAVDSVDSLRLLEKLDAACEAKQRRLSVLVELNVGGEAAKTGVNPESDELEKILTARPRHIDIHGLMTVPPFTEDPERARPFFRVLTQYRDRIAARNLPGISMGVLSMGMSHDFEVAIEEGATCVRIGTAIFGERPTT